MKTTFSWEGSFAAAVILSALLFYSSPVQAALTADECDITTGSVLASPACPMSNPNQAVLVSNFHAVRTDPGLAGTPIDAWNYCRYVDNVGTKSLFVPFRVPIEWTSFISNHPSDSISLTTCSRPGSLNIPNDYSTFTNVTNPWYDPALACDTPQTQATSLPYGRTGSTITAVATFSCKVNGLCDNASPPNCGASQQWTQTATATFTAGVAPDSAAPTPSGGWNLSKVVYSGNMPTANKAPPPLVNGICGSANGTSVGSAPSGGLCDTGIASSVSGSGPWFWTCDGSNKGTDESCSANYTPTYTGAWTVGDCSLTCGGGIVNYPTCTGGNGLCDPSTRPAFGQACNKQSCQSDACTIPAVDGFGFSGYELAYNSYPPLAAGTQIPSGTSLFFNQFCNSITAYQCENGTLVAGASSPNPCNLMVCFPPDTPVLMADDTWVPIATIKSGDRVVSFDNAGKKIFKTIKNLKITPDQKLRSVNGVRISVFQEVELLDGSYKRVNELQLADRLMKADGTPETIHSLEEVAGQSTVYNIILENDEHIRFVAAGLRVRN